MILILLILSAGAAFGTNCTYYDPTYLYTYFKLQGYSNITYLGLSTISFKRSSLAAFNGTFFSDTLAPLFSFNISAGEDCVASHTFYRSNTSTFYLHTTCQDPAACNFKLSIEGGLCDQQCGLRTCGSDSCGGFCGYCDGLCEDGTCTTSLSYSKSQTPAPSSLPSSTPPDSPSSISSPESLTPSEKAGVSVGVIGVCAIAGVGWFYFAKYYHRKDKDLQLSSGF